MLGSAEYQLPASDERSTIFPFDKLGVDLSGSADSWLFALAVPLNEAGAFFLHESIKSSAKKQRIKTPKQIRILLRHSFVK
jgi:hypothetical protein